MPEPLADRILLIFAKKPEPGEVKTRLAKELGAEKAAEVYRRLAEAVWAGTASREYQRWLVFEPPHEKRAMQQWLRGADAYVPQAPGSLGDRLKAAFRLAFNAGARAVAVIATDAPQVTSHDIMAAFRLLSSGRRAAIGPCPDGGYWLLALADFREDVFSGVQWSSSKVFEQTMAKLHTDGDAPGLLRVVQDIDVLSDLKAVGAPWSEITDAADFNPPNGE